MKQLIKFSLFSSLLLSTQAFAINPIQGFYGGLIGEVSHGPSNDQVFFREDAALFHGTVTYSSISGGAGGYIGYKYSHFRVEAEGLYNRISTGPLTVGTCVIQSANVLTPTGFCPQATSDHFREKALGYSGSSSGTYGLLNAFWDFYSDEPDSYFSPYLGIGLGVASIKNSSNFINTINLYSHGHSIIGNGTAAQGIIGVSYYMDDFTWAGMDYRYLTTKLKADLENELGANLPTRNYTLNTLNFTINFAFDKGAIN